MGKLMSEPEYKFDALMEHVRLGDNRALAVLIALYEPEIARTAQGLLGRALRSLLDPTDLVQSVHVQLILGLKQKKFSVANPDQLRSLALTLLRHKFIQHWRRYLCQVRHNSALVMTAAPLERRIAAAGGELDPAQSAEYKELLDRLYGHLRIEERRLVVMRLQGYSTREIAAELRIDPAALRVRLSRLRKRLRQEPPLSEWVRAALSRQDRQRPA